MAPLRLSLVAALAAVLFAVPTNGQGMCSSPDDGHGGHIVDITATISASLPTWLSDTGLGEGHRTEPWSMLNGDDANASELTFSAHTGTHVDAPRHFVPWKNQMGMETVLLTKMMLVQMKQASRLTKDVQQNQKKLRQ